MSINEKYHCPVCKKTDFLVDGFFVQYDAMIPTISIHCANCGNCSESTELHYSFFSPLGNKIKCNWCQKYIFHITGYFNLNSEMVLRLKCGTYSCKHTQILPSRITFQVMGQHCSACKEYGVDRSWNKDKRGYDIKCYICGIEDFEEAD